MSDMFFIVVLAILSVSLAVVMGLIIREKRKKRIVYEKYASGNSLPYASEIYSMLQKLPVINRYFLRLRKKLDLLYPKDAYTAGNIASKIMLKALLTALVCVAFIIIVSDGDVFFMITSMFIAAVVVSNFVSNSINKIEYRLLSELRSFLDNVRHFYYETNQIDDAVLLAMDIVSYDLKLHVKFFHDITESTKPFDEVQQYSEIAPNRFFMTFASICAFIKEYGDDVVDGHSVFLKNIEYLKDVISDELISLDFIKNIFSGIVFVCIFPVVFIKPIGVWGKSIMPEMGEFYDGAAGIITIGVIYIITIIVYELIISMRDGRRRDEQYHPVIDMLLRNKYIKHFLVLHDNYNASRTEKTGRMLNATGNSMGTQGFFLQRVMIAMAVFLIINSTSVYIIINTTDRLLENYTDEFTGSLIPSEEYRATMREIAAEYAVNYKYIRDTDAGILVTQIAEKEAIKKNYAEMIVSVIKGRAEAVSKQHYRWYMFLFAIAGAFVAYYVPYYILVHKNKMAKEEQLNELEQFQTLAIMLMNMDGITLNTILEWMERFSFCFREDIRRCILMLEKSETEALEMMKNTDYMPFANFVDCLLSIDKVGVRLAFAELEQERMYNRNKTQQNMKHVVERKARLCRTMAFIPLYAVLYGYLIIPFVVYVFNMFKDFENIF